MTLILLDTSALLTLRDNEPGADRVADALYGTDGTRCCGCFISLMEIYYRVWKDQSADAGHLAYEQCLSLPMEWIHESPGLLIEAARIKATHRLSLADAWIGACALQQEAMLMHKDPEFEALDIAQIRLPYKPVQTRGMG